MVFDSAFFVNEIAWCLDRVPNFFKIIVIFVLSFSGMVIPQYFRLPYAMDISCAVIGFYYIGNFYHRKLQKEKMLQCTDVKSKYKLLFSICFIILGSFLAFKNGEVDLREGKYSNGIIFYIAPCLIVYGLYHFSKLICNSNSAIILYIRKIGENSIVYVVLHQLFIYIVVPMFIQPTSIAAKIYKNMLIVVLALIGCHIGTICMNFKKMKWLIGKSIRC